MSKTKANGASGTAAQRSAARLAAVQAIYQIEMTGTESEKVIGEFLEFRLEEQVDGLKLDQADRALFTRLVGGVVAETNDLDDMLAGALDEAWTLERLERLLLSLLRVGIYELCESLDVPARVIINEYVDIGHAFFSGKEPGMVNGLLDHLARALRVEEFEGDGRG